MSLWNIFKKKEKQKQKIKKTPSLPTTKKKESNKSDNNTEEELVITDELLKDLIYDWESGDEIINSLVKEASNQTEANVKFIEYLINLIDSEKLEIPMLPDIVMKIINLSENPDTEISKYVELIKSDQAIALKVMKLANSTMYKGIRDVNDLNLAISRIGINELKNLVLMLSLQSKIFKNKEFKELIEEIWKTSLLTSILSSKLASYYSLNASSAYTIALTHDVGEIIVFNSVRGYEQFYKRKYKIDAYFIKRIAKSYHQEISAFTLAHWNFSKEQVDIVRNHHTPPINSSNEYHKLLFTAYQTSVILLSFKFNKDNIYNFPYEFLIKFSKLPLSEDAFYLLLKNSLKEFNDLSLIIS